MTAGQISVLYRRIAAVTTKYGLLAPVEPADAEVLRAALGAAVPEYWVRVTAIPGNRLAVEVGEHAERRLYYREMLPVV